MREPSREEMYSGDKRTGDVQYNPLKFGNYFSQPIH
jgi:hypothetical protein